MNEHTICWNTLSSISAKMFRVTSKLFSSLASISNFSFAATANLWSMFTWR